MTRPGWLAAMMSGADMVGPGWEPPDADDEQHLPPCCRSCHAKLAPGHDCTPKEDEDHDDDRA